MKRKPMNRVARNDGPGHGVKLPTKQGGDYPCSGCDGYFCDGTWKDCVFRERVSLGLAPPTNGIS